MGEVIKLKVATSEEVINLKSASGSLAVEAVSPRVSFEKVDGGTRLDITDVEGKKSTIIPDGEKGDSGESYIFDEHPTDNSPNPVRSRGLKSEFDSVRSAIQYFYDSAVEAVLNSEIRLNMKFGQKQDVLTFDEYPTVNSDNPVKSNGIKILIDAIASTIPRHMSDLIDDSGHYTKPPQGIPASDLAYGVIPDISQKQDLLSFDQTPTLQSMNPVTSNGIKRTIDTVYNQLSGETDLKLLAKANRVNECTEGNFAALDENGNLVDSGNKASDFVASTKLVSSTENGLIKAGGGGAVKTIAGNPGCLYINTPSDSTIKAGTNDNFVAGIGSQHKSVFYGLAKAAGDTTQASSSNTVGTYTETAKSKIHEMLDAPVTVSGTDPVISGKAGIRYVCGTCDTLTLTPPASGIVDVVFTSGTTPTVLSVPSSIKWPGWFDPESLEASTTYEINILDGVYGMVMAWT